MATTTDPLQLPALQPPPGQTSNLVNPVNDLHAVVIATLVICLTIPTALIPLRMYVRMRILKTFQLVDGTCLLAEYDQDLNTNASLVVICMLAFVRKLRNPGIISPRQRYEDADPLLYSGFLCGPRLSLFFLAGLWGRLSCLGYHLGHVLWLFACSSSAAVHINSSHSKIRTKYPNHENLLAS